MNVIARLEYELAYYDSAVYRFNHYTTRTPPVCTGMNGMKFELTYYEEFSTNRSKQIDRDMNIDDLNKT